MSIDNHQAGSVLCQRRTDPANKPEKNRSDGVGIEVKRKCPLPLPGAILEPR